MSCFYILPEETISKIMKNAFLFHLKSSFRSRGIQIFAIFSLLFHIFQIQRVKWSWNRPGCKKKTLHVWPSHAFMKLITFGVRSHMSIYWRAIAYAGVWARVTGNYRIPPLVLLESRVSTSLFCTATHWPIFFLYVTLTPVKS